MSTETDEPKKPKVWWLAIIAVVFAYAAMALFLYLSGTLHEIPLTGQNIKGSLVYFIVASIVLVGAFAPRHEFDSLAVQSLVGASNPRTIRVVLVIAAIVAWIGFPAWVYLVYLPQR